jgi:outer membrane lipoprotein-sorting protein
LPLKAATEIEMSEDNSNQTDELITRIADAFEQVEIPPRPTDAATIQMLNQPASLHCARPRVRRMQIMKWIAPLAAIAATLAIAIFLWPSSQNIVFAQVVEQLKKADAVTFTITLKALPTPESAPVTGKGYAKSPNLLRYDLTANGQTTVNITNAKGDLIALNPATNKVTIWAGAMTAGADMDIVRQLKEADPDLARRAVDSDGQSAPNLEVFELSPKDGVAIGKVWVDKQTKLPVRIEMHGPPGSGLGSTVYSNFNWNATIADSVFEIPAGYTIDRNSLLAEPTNEELVAAFRIRQAFSTEPYPADFLAKDPGLVIGQLAYDHSLAHKENYQRQLKVLRPIFSTFGVSDQDAQNAKTLQERIDYLCMKLDQWANIINEHGAWIGTGVRPGEKKPLCWWRQPGNKQTSVLYGDLTIRDADRPPTSK